MKREKKTVETQKIKYLKPALTKHKKLRDITAFKSSKPFLGCTKF